MQTHQKTTQNSQISLKIDKWYEDEMNNNDKTNPHNTPAKNIDQKKEKEKRWKDNKEE